VLSICCLKLQRLARWLYLDSFYISSLNLDRLGLIGLADGLPEKLARLDAGTVVGEN
jgi:hypothetical protein